MKRNYEQPEVEVLVFTLEESFLESGVQSGTGSGMNLDDPENVDYDVYF